jgi:Flp pilus assembly protein TadG
MVATPRRPSVGASLHSLGTTGDRGRNDRGAAMVELALVLPVLVLLLVGIIEAGRAYGANVALQGAARDGARLVALGSASTAVESAVRATSGPADVTQVSQVPCAGTGTGTAEVTVRAEHQWRLPFVDLGVSTLMATARMPCER